MKLKKQLMKQLQMGLTSSEKSYDFSDEVFIKRLLFGQNNYIIFLTR